MIPIDWTPSYPDTDLGEYQNSLCWCKYDDELAKVTKPSPLRHCVKHRDTENPRFKPPFLEQPNEDDVRELVGTKSAEDLSKKSAEIDPMEDEDEPLEDGDEELTEIDRQSGVQDNPEFFNLSQDGSAMNNSTEGRRMNEQNPVHFVAIKPWFDYMKNAFRAKQDLFEAFCDIVEDYRGTKIESSEAAEQLKDLLPDNMEIVHGFVQHSHDREGFENLPLLLREEDDDDDDMALEDVVLAEMKERKGKGRYPRGMA